MMNFDDAILARWMKEIYCRRQMDIEPHQHCARKLQKILKFELGIGVILSLFRRICDWYIELVKLRL